MIIDNITYQLAKSDFFLNKLDNIKKKKKIISVTGIKKLYKVRNNEDIISLAISSLKKVKSKIQDSDAIIFVTQTPKFNIPPNSFLIQKELKIKKNSMVFDVNQGCSGYIYALALAQGLFKSQNLNKILIITSDNYSRYAKKLNVKMIFSDCATSTVLRKSEKKIIFDFYSDGNLSNHLNQKYNNYDTSLNSNEILMNGTEIFRFTIDTVPKKIEEFLKKKNIRKDEIDYFLFHQASKIVLDNILRKLGIDKLKTIQNIHNYGNTVSSSIPLIISNNKKKLKNKKLILCGFGVGLSIGICYVET
jgi:3-oxoacyl-[acyl-carrier-protein] synthase-3